MIRIKRIYEPPNPEDGMRVLVDRLWPRGLKKEDAKVDWWAKELAPSNELRRWFGHDPERYSEFVRRYQKELEQSSSLEQLKSLAESPETATLLYAAKDEQHNNAQALKEIIDL